ncbi:MAG: galactose mutarotase [Deltaproteobacteria bacterium]|nr:galactose mutarotase [Deltaproteobacteria bacterium]
MSQRPQRFVLVGRDGVRAELADFGATLVALHLPDRAGHLADVVLGFDDLASYGAVDNPWFGAAVGRVANRITDGRFTLDGSTYQLPCNDGRHHLHGGVRGLSRRAWRVSTQTPHAVGFMTASADGDEGYPGTIEVGVTYTLDGEALTLEYVATTDRPTPINLSNHTYWNLAGHAAGPVLDHELWVDAEAFTPTDATVRAR